MEKSNENREWKYEKTGIVAANRFSLLTGGYLALGPPLPSAGFMTDSTVLFYAHHSFIHPAKTPRSRKRQSA
ncbi:hypothetical protein [Acidovorax radicis]|uniref:hypothetical protein n=1 Tax=Acidovorax radicis TaxID=758826 RepID=UPI001CFAC0BB|nr:hypothetical protein [Acidovorax radicis]UCV00600.1 hypothetical protein KI609_07540 [Acidovorax radicis]